MLFLCFFPFASQISDAAYSGLMIYYTYGSYNMRTITRLELFILSE